MGRERGGGERKGGHQMVDIRARDEKRRGEGRSPVVVVALGG